jgi:hypothetical protein
MEEERLQRRADARVFLPSVSSSQQARHASARAGACAGDGPRTRNGCACRIRVCATRLFRAAGLLVHVYPCVPSLNSLLCVNRSDCLSVGLKLIISLSLPLPRAYRARLNGLTATM